MPLDLWKSDRTVRFRFFETGGNLFTHISHYFFTNSSLSLFISTHTKKTSSSTWRKEEEAPTSISHAPTTAVALKSFGQLLCKLRYCCCTNSKIVVVCYGCCS
ncbi:hypothetical protein QJS10_CPB17g02032 [Acorus calamus]|uniref:Uncharacterized protein n=1 Tax=Acorus calamus TaxID=4465 RepID=A0AAV9CXB9_ACOCL|nr:hypothetical protein QJS10_CPB17g02032 [Acorus calamus]